MQINKIKKKTKLLWNTGHAVHQQPKKRKKTFIGLGGPLPFFRQNCSWITDFELQPIFFRSEKFWENHHKSQILGNYSGWSLVKIGWVLLYVRVTSLSPLTNSRTPGPQWTPGILGTHYKAILVNHILIEAEFDPGDIFPESKWGVFP